MKYSSFKIGAQNTLEMQFKCHACKNELVGTEKFCPECGVKLNKSPRYIKDEVVLNLLNDAVATGVLKDRSPQQDTIPEDASISKMEESTDAPSTDKKTGCCVGGYGEDNYSECPLYGEDNYSECPFKEGKACTGIVCPSLPPQYPICQFCGSGFVKCSDVNYAVPQ